MEFCFKSALTRDYKSVQALPVITGYMYTCNWREHSLHRPSRAPWAARTLACGPAAVKSIVHPPDPHVSKGKREWSKKTE